MEDLPALIRNSKREIQAIRSHWEEGLALGSGELCALAAASLLLHASFALPELAGLLEEAEGVRRPLLR